MNVGRIVYHIRFEAYDSRRWCTPPSPLEGGGEPSVGQKNIGNTGRRRKLLQGAEADLHCDTVVQFCGAPPPPLRGGLAQGLGI